MYVIQFQCILAHKTPPARFSHHIDLAAFQRPYSVDNARRRLLSLHDRRIQDNLHVWIASRRNVDNIAHCSSSRCSHNAERPDKTRNRLFIFRCKQPLLRQLPLELFKTLIQLSCPVERNRLCVQLISAVPFKHVDRTSLQIRPSLNFQSNDSHGLLQGASRTGDSLEGETETSTREETGAYNVGADLMLRHRFLKEGRTLSWMVSGKMSNTDKDTYTDYLNTVYGANIQPVSESYSQFAQTANNQFSLRSNLSYTEKLTDRLQLQFGYKLSYSDTDNDRKTYTPSAVSDLYEQLDESLSNEYQSGYLTQAGNAGLRYRAGKFNATLGVDAQWAELSGDLVYPQPDQLSHRYFSLLPSFTMRYAPSSAHSLQLRYRSKSVSPSVTSLQDVIDNSNPLFLSAGNPNLDQQVSHTANLRYIHTTKSGQTFIAMVGATIQQDYVADSTFIAKEDIKLSPACPSPSCCSPSS